MNFTNLSRAILIFMTNYIYLCTLYLFRFNNFNLYGDFKAKESIFFSLLSLINSEVTVELLLAKYSCLQRYIY